MSMTRLQRVRGWALSESSSVTPAPKAFRAKQGVPQLGSFGPKGPQCSASLPAQLKRPCAPLADPRQPDPNRQRLTLKARSDEQVTQVSRGPSSCLSLGQPSLSEPVTLILRWGDGETADPLWYLVH